MELNIEQALQQGILAHKDGKLRDAETFYRSILQSQPKHSLANHCMGVLAVSVNETKKALPLFKTAVEVSPEIGQFWVSYVDALIQDGDFEKARGVIKQGRVEGLAEDRVSALVARMKSAENSGAPRQSEFISLGKYLNERQFSKAETLAVSLTQRFPKHPFAWKVLGAVLYQTGQVSKSVAPSQKAVQLAPDDDNAHNNLGISLRVLGKLNEATKSFRKAVALKSDCAEAHANLGITLQEMGRLEEAEAALKQAILFKPDFAESHRNLGNVLRGQDKLEEAANSYNQAIRLKLDFAEAHSDLGITLHGMGRLEEAVNSYNQAIIFKPDFAGAHSNLGVVLQELGRLEEAEANCRLAIKLKPEYAEAHYNLGNTLKELNRLDEATENYSQAIKLKPDFAEAYNNLGNTLRKRGMLKDAEKSYAKAIAIDPSYLSAKHMLAALRGETTKTAPRDYVEALFNASAGCFDSSLVNVLEYKIPKVITDIIIKDNEFNSSSSIIDLGCGTGLFGAEIKQFCGYLEGVDLSRKMLDEAKKKNVYDKLIKQDIVDYLSNKSLKVDYFVATDVFIYVGDLLDVFRLIKSQNRTSGRLAFSTEDYDGDGFFLEKSGRYSHSKRYIDGLCEKFGYKLRYFGTQALRNERNEPIKGGIYLVEF